MWKGLGRQICVVGSWFEGGGCQICLIFGAGWLVFQWFGWLSEPSSRFPGCLIGTPYQTSDVFIPTVADSIKSPEKMEFVTASNIAHNR